MPYDELDGDRPPKGWTAESAMGLGLVIVALAAVLIIGGLVLMGW